MRQYLLLIAFVVIVSAILLTIVFSPQKMKVILLHDGDQSMIKAARDALEDLKLPINIALLRYDAKELHEELSQLREEGYRLIVGPRLSAHAKVLLPLLEALDLYAISPTVSSPEIVGKSWRFVTLSIPDYFQTRMIADELNQMGVESIVLVVDPANEPYMTQYMTLFRLDFRGTIIGIIEFDGNSLLVEASLKQPPDAFLLITDGVAAGKVASFLVKKDYTGEIFCSDFSDDSDLRLFSDGVLDRVNVFSAVSKEMNTREDANYVNTFNALLLAQEIARQHGNNLKEAFLEIADTTVEGIDGAFTVLDSRYVRKDSYTLRSIGEQK